MMWRRVIRWISTAPRALPRVVAAAQAAWQAFRAAKDGAA